MSYLTPGPAVNTKVQLDYVLASDISALSATATTWTDLISNQTFTVDDANSVVEVDVSGFAFTNTTASLQAGTRVVIDSAGTPINKMLSGMYWAPSTAASTNLFAGAGTVTLTGLPAGSHTLKIQINASATSSWYCRPATNPNQEFLNIRVLERKQSSSPPSSTPAPAVRCYNSAAISIPDSVWTSLGFDTNRVDQGTSVRQHSTSSNTSRLTCQQAGMYQISGNLEYAASGAGSLRYARLMLNGTTCIARVWQAPNGTTNVLNVSVLYQLNVGDYVELQLYQDSGGALNVLTLANMSPEFMMARVDSGGQGFVPIPMVKTANYTLTAQDCMVVAGASSLTMTLPAASTRAPGMPIVIKNDNFTPTSIAAAGSDTIDGASSYNLVGAYKSVTLVGDGISVWRVI